ncbi:MAG: tail fiber domain-containing protein [Nitrospinae bacterium]|nr:tail fiber domain-containing protein [Nitrospinota bacterium]
MAGCCSSNPPSPPDPFAVAQAQAGFNRQSGIDTTQLNMVNQNTPYGSLEYSKREPAFDQAGFDTATAQYETDLTAYDKRINEVRDLWGYGGGQRDIQPDSLIGRQLSSISAPTAVDRQSFYSMDPELSFQATQTLAGPQQEMLDLQNQAGIGFGKIANTQLTALSDRLSSPLPQFNEQYRTDAFNSTLERFAPIQEQDRRRMESMYANQGITAGSEAWNRGTDDFNRGITDFRLAADRQALGEAGGLYALEAESRSQPINELTAMLNQSQVRPPSFVPTPQSQIAAPNYQQAAYNTYQGQADNYAQQLQQQNAMFGGLFGLGGAGIGYAGLSKLAGAGLSTAAINALPASMFITSDRRLKTNIRKIGLLPNGLNVYTFNYIWGGPEYTGVMADEVRRIMPHAVLDVGGYDAVNYAEVLR